MTTNVKEDIENKIHELTKMVIENHESGNDDPENLIHPDFITALEALGTLQQEGDISADVMQELNDLYKKHKTIYENAGNTV